MTTYEPLKIEQKWQKFWQEKNIDESKLDLSRPKYYVLEMLPYPSGHIHMGHLRNYTMGDVVARFKKANGFNVLHPMGWDAFGLPAENAAIEKKLHPGAWTYSNIDHMREQIKSFGISYDWSREVATCDAEYYKEEQKFFLDFYKNNLAYRKESFVNWDPVDNTVLANEQVVNGRGWRSGALVERKKLNQWFLKITDFAEELLDEVLKLEGWPEPVRNIQEKWIGKSIGAIVKFKLENEIIEIYTTRPETLFGASFCAISPFHPLAEKLAQSNNEIAEFIIECGRTGTAEGDLEKQEKKGIATGLKLINPINNQAYPLYIANFVLMEYGTGAIFGCPAHDERDFEFATKYNLPIIPVIEDEKLVNSEFLNGLSVEEAKKAAIQKLEQLEAGTGSIKFRLRDWGVSRQRYWGCPIPMIYCDTCGVVPVKEEDLPVKLPEDVTFDKPGNPLEHHPTWKHTNCPSCGGKAVRETDTFDTFFESSWYFLRYCTPKNELALERDSIKYWMPVDQYIGGIEHAAMHLLYARFFIKALSKCGYIAIKEPFTNLLTQGMVLHATYKDKNGNWITPKEAAGRDDVVVGRLEKMSKSKKNVVDPADITASYGADTARFFILSDSPPEKEFEWSSSGVEGSFRYLNKLYRFVTENIVKENLAEPEDRKYLAKVNQSIKAITEQIEKMHFNSAIASIREFSNYIFALEKKEEIKHAVSILLKLLYPFTPHITEELWAQIGNATSIIHASWPLYNAQYLENDTVILAIQVNGKLRGTVEIAKDLPQEEIKALVLAMSNIQKFIEGQEIKKFIVVPNKIINIVV